MGKFRVGTEEDTSNTGRCSVVGVTKAVTSIATAAPHGKKIIIAAAH